MFSEFFYGIKSMQVCMAGFLKDATAFARLKVKQTNHTSPWPLSNCTFPGFLVLYFFLASSDSDFKCFFLTRVRNSWRAMSQMTFLHLVEITRQSQIYSFTYCIFWKMCCYIFDCIKQQYYGITEFLICFVNSGFMIQNLSQDQRLKPSSSTRSTTPWKRNLYYVTLCQLR